MRDLVYSLSLFRSLVLKIEFSTSKSKQGVILSLNGPIFYICVRSLSSSVMKCWYTFEFILIFGVENWILHVNISPGSYSDPKRSDFDFKQVIFFEITPPIRTLEEGGGVPNKLISCFFLTIWRRPLMGFRWPRTEQSFKILFLVWRHSRT